MEVNPTTNLCILYSFSFVTEWLCNGLACKYRNAIGLQKLIHDSMNEIRNEFAALDIPA
jgi:hypothetical protein